MFKEPPTLCRVCGRAGLTLLFRRCPFHRQVFPCWLNLVRSHYPNLSRQQTQITAETSQSQLFQRKSIFVSSPLYIITVDLESTNQDVIKVQIFSPHLQRLTVTVWMFLDELPSVLCQAFTAATSHCSWFAGHSLRVVLFSVTDKHALWGWYQVTDLTIGNWEFLGLAVCLLCAQWSSVWLVLQREIIALCTPEFIQQSHHQ